MLEKDGSVAVYLAQSDPTCVLSLQDWKLIENARITVLILYLLFQYVYEKKPQTAYINVCKDAKAIHQLTLHDKSYTGFF